ncbi:MAG: Mut7-C RNAse domain-containing protein, partial [Methylomonas sp.]
DHGYWLRNVLVERQVDEVLRRFKLYDAIKPFTLCPVCNGRLAPVSKADILDDLEPKTRLYYEAFHRCSDCRQIYWQGSHIQNMRQRFADFLTPSETSRDLSGLD